MIEDMGIRGIVSYPTEPLLVAMKAMMDLMAEIRDKGTISETYARLKPLSHVEFFEYMGLQDTIDLNKRYVI